MVTQLKIYTAFTAGDQTKMDRSFPSCTTEHVHQQRQNGCFRDGIQRSNRVWICCCRLMKSWLIMFFFNTKFALVRSDDWWVSFTRPWAVFTRLGRPDEWLVRTLQWNIYAHYCIYIMTPSNGNIFCITGLLCKEFTSHWWIPCTKASDMELWCFLWSVPESTVEQAMEMPVI